MFRRLLVANRGEVAVRVARTCRRLGVETVATYSEADAGASWLGHFDRTVCIGGAHPSHSYLDQDAILQAAVQEGCQAIHPGWGFLAENATFATRVSQLRITWVGPPPNAIRLMGDKALARDTMTAAGVPTIPGSDGLVRNEDDARRIAGEIGYPLLIKATGGGGGKGMRLCREESELEEAFRTARQEAAASFGNDGVYLERFIESGRHIEFQILCDTYGRAIHLGERECSVQRRHQKLIEEAPSPALDAATRDELGTTLAEAAARLGYEGVGTVELLRDADGSLYFMEMNTRLQVEHPVTEAITGIDLVEEQLRVAANRPLERDQSDITWSGAAIEARINAEDPHEDFRPAPGRITKMHFPRDHGPGEIRLDSHIEAPADIPPFYDSLIAKVISHAEDRAAAIDTLHDALAASEIEGVPTTVPAHCAVLRDEGFASGEYDTRIMERITLPEGD